MSSADSQRIAAARRERAETLRMLREMICQEVPRVARRGVASAWSGWLRKLLRSQAFCSAASRVRSYVRRNESSGAAAPAARGRGSSR